MSYHQDATIPPTRTSGMTKNDTDYHKLHRLIINLLHITDMLLLVNIVPQTIQFPLSAKSKTKETNSMHNADISPK